MPYLLTTTIIAFVGTWSGGPRYRWLIYFIALGTAYIGIDPPFLFTYSFQDHLPGLAASAILLPPLQLLFLRMKSTATRTAVVTATLVSILAAWLFARETANRWAIENAQRTAPQVLAIAQTNLDAMIKPEYRLELHINPTKYEEPDVRCSARSKFLDVSINSYPNGQQEIFIDSRIGNIAKYLNPKSPEQLINNKSAFARAHFPTAWMIGGARIGGS